MKCVLVCWEGKRDGDGEGGEPQKGSSQGRGCAHPTFGQTWDGRRRRRDIRCILARGFLVRPPVDVGDATAAERRRGVAWAGGPRGWRAPSPDATGSGGRARARQPMPVPTTNKLPHYSNVFWLLRSLPRSDQALFSELCNKDELDSNLFLDWFLWLQTSAWFVYSGLLCLQAKSSRIQWCLF